MLRPVTTCALVLAALAAPALLAASGPRADLADRPAVHRDFGATHAAAAAPHHPAASAPTALWAAEGGYIDPDGVTSTAACQPGTCGDGGSISDPNGLTAPAPEPVGALDLVLVWLRSLLSL